MFLSSLLPVHSYLPTSRWKLHSLAAELRYTLTGSMRDVEVELDGERLLLTGYVASESIRRDLCQLAQDMAFDVPVICMVAVVAEPGLRLV